MLQQMVDDGLIPGYQYMVLEDGEEIFTAWGGVKDVEKKLPVDRHTLFMANSTSKTITATAVLQLADKNLLDLDEDVREYVGDIFPTGKKLTCRQLITHTAGVKNPLPLQWHHKIEDSGEFNREQFERQVLEKNKKLTAEPGHRYLYSNPGYLLLGKIVEAVSQMKFEEYTEKHLFQPLRANRNQLTFYFDSPEYLAHGYEDRFSFNSVMARLLAHGWFFKGKAGRKWLCFRHIKHNSPAYGGLYCNMDGLSLFLKDIMAEEPVLLNPETRRQMFEPQTNARGQVVPTTHGWDHGHLAGLFYITRPGGGPGFHSNIRIYPEKKRATILLINKTLLHAKLINLFSDKLDVQYVL